MDVVLLIKKKILVTQLSERDKKILNKYSKYYTNVVESNIIKTNVLGDGSIGVASFRGSRR